MHRVLIIGVGSIGERHLRCFQSTGRADVSLCEPNEALRHRVAEQYKVGHVFADLDAALSAPHDAAVVCTPAPMHVPMATRLANAGLHTLIEKPLSTSVDGVEALQRIVKEKKLVTAVAYVHRANVALGDMRRAIRGGRFGRPVEVYAVGGQHFPFYRPAYRDIYYRDRRQGGGAIQDAMTHILNAVEWFVGPIAKLVVDAEHKVLDGVEVEDTVHLLARHGGDSNVMASYVLNQHQAPTENAITVVCEKGTARIDLVAQRWTSMTQPAGEWRQEFAPAKTPDRDTLFVAQAHTFLDATEGKGPVACTLEEGLQTLRVNLAALRACDQTCWV
ncbi:MAG: Gfo/Idh/MocA family protein, partial [Tepidisphaeraceae bacterium]